jgi:hypothetical protein
MEAGAIRLSAFGDYDSLGTQPLGGDASMEHAAAAYRLRFPANDVLVHADMSDK